MNSKNRLYTLFFISGPRTYYLGKRFFPLLLLLLATVLFAENRTFTISTKILKNADKIYGAEAVARLLDWQQFIRQDQSENDLEKLQKVNNFFNRFEFVSDALHWQKKDYWATPIEFLASDGGDCEDFAMAKYFTLKRLGVEEKKINMTYVKAWKLNQAHMVLTYYETPGSEPLVLDNLIPDIKPASQRDDLLPVFSFNASSLWIAKERGRGNLVGESKRLKLWTDLLERMPDSLK
ncbi:transglutaminase-like cysteine peptidase [Desulforhopalus singaporensis]|uniref:Transglutaminase-like cysteine proteinase BTLCP n=1 Tax=Desulforhopalus singaporensis TaxID=91360 RepID=A0A1H0VXX7_9BACT|nr:transglutaminase-like cysteine peptidase [Desulforhopalus singaporensis]SDP83173.1 transglutaminase-like cysteine proteinase BTLCP [Desulforhopalus singaporensis]